VLGVSCWLAAQPASQPETWYSWYQTWLLSVRQLVTNLRYWGRGGLITKRYWIWKAQQEKAQRELWIDKERGYYFCNIVTVRPDAQGRGIGRSLFEVVTDRADREGVKCYLESSKSEPNVQIYEKLGFHMVKTMDCEDAGDVCRVSTPTSILLHIKSVLTWLVSCFVWSESQRQTSDDRRIGLVNS
jgi:GNAT superfamily N-acetyltransferase